LSKPEVLFLHGAGGGGWEWNIWVRVFKAHGFKVHAPDLMPSAKGLVETALEDYSRQVQQHLLAMPSPKILIGASLGGLLAMMNAKHAEVLVLINPMPPAPWHAEMPVHTTYPAITAWRSQGIFESTRKALPDGDEASRLFAFRHWRDESGALLNAALRGITLDLPVGRRLLMASEIDGDVPFSLSKSMAEGIQAEFVYLRETTHLGALMGKNANHFAAQAVGWLNAVLSSN
jgi:pimeloyl-ACP methyl ester carboxylesterase